MGQIKVGWTDHGNSSRDIYSSGPLFTWVGDDGNGNIKQCHRWTRCREMLGTYFLGALLNKRSSLGDISFSPAVNLSPALDHLMLAARIPPKDGKEGLTYEDKLPVLVHPIEDRLGLPHSQALEVEAPPARQAGAVWRRPGRTWLFQASPFWHHAPPLLALYLLLLKASAYSLPEAGTVEEKIAYTEKQGLPGFAGHTVSALALAQALREHGTSAWKAPSSDYWRKDYYSSALAFFDNLYRLQPQLLETYWEGGVTAYWAAKGVTL